jgi:hypothetical protein
MKKPGQLDFVFFIFSGLWWVIRWLWTNFQKIIIGKLPIFLSVCSLGLAGDLKTTDGKVYREAKLLSVEPSQITIEYAGSISTRLKATIPVARLPEGPTKERCLAAAKQKVAELAKKEAEELKTRSRLEPECAGVWHRLIDGKAKFVYGFNVKNTGGKAYNGDLTLSIISKTKGTIFTKTFAASIEPGETRGLTMDLFTGPASVHGDAAMVRWRMDAGKTHLLNGDLPAGFEDDIDP